MPFSEAVRGGVGVPTVGSVQDQPMVCGHKKQVKHLKTTPGTPGHVTSCCNALNHKTNQEKRLGSYFVTLNAPNTLRLFPHHFSAGAQRARQLLYSAMLSPATSENQACSYLTSVRLSFLICKKEDEIGRSHPEQWKRRGSFGVRQADRLKS